MEVDIKLTFIYVRIFICFKIYYVNTTSSAIQHAMPQVYGGKWVTEVS